LRRWGRGLAGCCPLPVAMGVAGAGAGAAAAGAGALSGIVTGPFATVIGPSAVVVVVVVVVVTGTSTMYTVLLRMTCPHCSAPVPAAPPLVGEGLVSMGVGRPGIAGMPAGSRGVVAPGRIAGTPAGSRGVAPGSAGTPTGDSGIASVADGALIPAPGIVPTKPAGGEPATGGTSTLAGSDATGKPFRMRH
jgi:hypothetical protein